MATFSKLDQFADHGKYKALLKTALAKAKTAPLRFYYFEKYKFGDKVFPLLVTDVDPTLVAELKKNLGNTTALGKCKLNADGELAFELENGKLNCANLKRYLAAFPGVPPVSVPSGNRDENDTAAAGAKPAAATAAKPVVPASAAAPSRVLVGNASGAAEASAAFNRLAPVAKQAIQDHPDQKARINELMAAAQNALKANAAEDVQKALGKALALIESLKSVKNEGAAAPGRKAALAAFVSARDTAAGGLKQLAGKIKAMGDPEGDAAIQMLKEIEDRIAVNPASLQEAAALEAYLKTDSTIADAETPNGLGVNVRVREPLLAALGKLKSQLSA